MKRRPSNVAASLKFAAGMLLLLALPAAHGQEQGAAQVSFKNQIAPILVKRCLACHGPADPKGDFQLHTFAGLMKPGATTAPSVTAAAVDKSEVFRLISSADADERMPKDADPLTAEQVELVKLWITQGATFDGPDPAATMASYIPREAHPAAPQAYPTTLPVTAVAFRPDGQEIAVSGYQEVTIWNPNDGTLLRRIGDVARRTYGLAYNPDGTMLAIASGKPGELGEVKLVDPNSGSTIRVLATMPDVAYFVSFNPAGTKLACCSADRSIRIFDVASGNQDVLIEDHADWVFAIAWNHDGTRLASASRDKTSKLFDAANGESLVTFPGHGEQVFTVAFSADGTQVITGGADKKIQVWNPADGNKIAEIAGFSGDVYQVLVRDNNLFSVSADRIVRQHQVSDRAQVRTYEGHADNAYCESFNAATGRLATGCHDGEVRIWNSADGTLIKNFKAAPGYVPPAS